jgi:hypothetical protein
LRLELNDLFLQLRLFPLLVQLSRRLWGGTARRRRRSNNSGGGCDDGGGD